MLAMSWLFNVHPVVLIIVALIGAAIIGELFVRITCPIKRMRDAYPDGCCPDCGEDIPTDCIDGDHCENCEHVFYYPYYTDDQQQ